MFIIMINKNKCEKQSLDFLELMYYSFYKLTAKKNTKNVITTLFKHL